MNTLTSYIKAINKQKSVVSIFSESHKTGAYVDGEIEVTEVEKTYHFNNGVVIMHKIERDNAPFDLLCEECWISYEVVDSGQQKITPLRKNFYNTCQESFWLKMQFYRE